MNISRPDVFTDIETFQTDLEKDVRSLKKALEDFRVKEIEHEAWKISTSLNDGIVEELPIYKQSQVANYKEENKPFSNASADS